MALLGGGLNAALYILAAFRVYLAQGHMTEGSMRYAKPGFG